jgi:hypothetical protein
MDAWDGFSFIILLIAASGQGTYSVTDINESVLNTDPPTVLLSIRRRSLLNVPLYVSNYANEVTQSVCKHFGL